jgi:hypothetical protein
MFRSTSSVLALLAAMTLPAVAADYGDWDDDLDGAADFRTSYPVEPGDWAGLGDDDDPVSLEMGVRYWYSMGYLSLSNDAGAFDATDTAHSGEVHLRVTDHSTNTFAKAVAGYGFAMTGSYTDPFSGGTVTDGRLGYLGADIGYNAFGDANTGVGPLVGYLYWNNSPRTDRSNFTTAESADDIGYDQNTGQTFLPMDSEDNNLDAHALRLGLQGKADFGMFDLYAEVAAVPYAKVAGTMGNDQTTTTIDNSVYAPGNISSMKASSTTLDGWGYGAMAEAFVGFHPTENMTVRLGGRAWYLQGTADVTYDQAFIGNPSDSDAIDPPNFDTPPNFGKVTYIETANPFSMLRLGVLGELTYRF